MKRGTRILVLGFAFLLSGCSTGTLSPVAFAKYIENEENGLKKQSRIADWEYTVQYRPAEYQLVQQYGPNKLSEQESDRLLKLKDGLVLFNVTVEHATYKQSTPLKIVSSNMSDYAKKEAYLLSNAGADFSLVCGKDTLAPSVYQFEPNYSLAPHDVMIVGFDQQKETIEENGMTLVYHDKFFGSGIIKFRFDGNDLRALPILKNN